MWAFALALAACSGDEASPATSAPAPTTSEGPATPVATLPESAAPASRRLVGDARPAVPAGAPGELSAVPIGVPRPYTASPIIDGVQMSFVVWNLTDAAVDGQALEVTVDDPAGDGESGLLLAMTPSHLEAGEWGLATFGFFAANPTEATTFTTMFAADDPVMNRAVDLLVSDVSAQADAEGVRTATITNVNDVAVGSPFTFAVHCFQGDELVSVSAELEDAANAGFTFLPGAEITLRFITDDACESVLIGAVTFHE